MSALSLLAKAEVCIAQEQWARAHFSLARARRQRSDPFLKAEILHKDADALRALGRFRESLSCYLSAQLLYRKLRVPTERLSALLGASGCLRVLGRFAEARRLWADVDRTPFRRGRGPEGDEVALERALVARGQGKFSEARRRLSGARRRWSRRKSSSSLARLQHAHWILGGVERFTGCFPQALRSFKEAVRLARQLGDASAEAFAWCGVAGVERVLGFGASSLAHYRRAHRALKKNRDPFGEAYGLCGQANAHRTYGSAASSLSLYRRSASLYRRLGDESSEGFAHWGLGGSLRRLKRYSLSRASYKRALRLFNKSRDERGCVMTNLGLARVEEDRGRIGTALHRAGRGLAVARAAGLRYETALARYEIGRLKNSLRPPDGLLGAMGISPSALNRWRDIP